jgi:hypothetical protein
MCDPYAGIESLGGPIECPDCKFVCPSVEQLRDGIKSRDRIREAHVAWLNEKYKLNPLEDLWNRNCKGCGFIYPEEAVMFGSAFYGEVHIPQMWDVRCKPKE